MKSSKRQTNNREFVVALAGNPNSGKTTLFNSLTGSHQHVGNWPGVTVEKKEGTCVIEGKSLKVVDLPGTYSLGAYSEDEAVARDYIVFEKPDVVVNIVDGTNLERNLYLTTQLLEMGANIIIALNMYDEIDSKQMEIDIDKLSHVFGVPVIPTIATRNKGIGELLQQIVKTAEESTYKDKGEIFKISYAKGIEKILNSLEDIIITDNALLDRFNPRWLALKLLEGDKDLMNRLDKSDVAQQLSSKIHEYSSQKEDTWQEDIEIEIAEQKYGFIGSVINQIVIRNRPAEVGSSKSDRIDRIITNRYLGIPIFILAMFSVFQFTFSAGEPLIGLIESMFGWIGSVVEVWLSNIGASELLNSLIVDGIITGVGSVFVFIPNIFLLFFAISLLEDSGYMSRAAYIMDRLMHYLGLHGKSFIPMIVGFGCNVPAILATRTLENRRDRLITILINPLMSCSARLPVYILFTAAFFSANQGLIILSLYLLGIVLAIIMGVLLKKFLFKGEASYFIMELPPYRIPTLKSTFIHMWERTSSFIRRAGTIIVAAVILIWVLSSLPSGVAYASQGSLLGRLGSFIAPIFRPAGFGTWEASVALFFGVVAKEVVVGTLGVIYGIGGKGLIDAISQNWTPLSAYSFMVITLIYTPCIATIGAIRRETNSWGWTGFAISYSLVLGWIMAVLVFQIGSLLGFV